MTKDYTLRILPKDAYDEAAVTAYLKREMQIKPTAVRILKRSIDARQRTVYVNLTVRVYVNERPESQTYQSTFYPDVTGHKEAIVVGAGPGGLFAALRLIELGIRPIVVERGKDVRSRKKDLARIRTTQQIDPESNYAFGEGGAGAYSDGKLFTRSKKRGNSEKILHVFVQHGASDSILVDAHPHIGTDCLPRVIENMRNTILRCGGEVHFETRMDRLIIKDNKVQGIECTHLPTGEKQEWNGPVILATGHSILDSYPLFTTVCTLRGTVSDVGESNCCLFPVTEKTWSDFCQIYNEKMASVPTAQMLRLMDREEYAKDAYFVHRDGVLQGIGIVRKNRIDAIAACRKGAGKDVLAALCRLIGDEEITLEVAENNQKAMALYARCGFLKTGETARWYKIL